MQAKKKTVGNLSVKPGETPSGAAFMIEKMRSAAHLGHYHFVTGELKQPR
jgi:hypothetical protein